MSANAAGSSLSEVSFEFSVQGGSDAFRVVTLHMVEAVSEPFSAAVEVATADPVDPAALLGQPALLTIDRGGQERAVHGVVAAVEDRGTTADQRVLEVTVVPRVWLLSRRSAHRIFQDTDAVTIAKEVLRDAGIYASPPGIVDRTTAPRPREYCVQYDETDLAFVQRLLAEEGLAFASVQSAQGEGIVFFDPSRKSSLDAVVPAELPVVGRGLATHGSEGLGRFDDAFEVVPTAVVARDWDFTHPASPLHQRAIGARDLGLTVQRHPARFVLGAYSEGGHTYGSPDGAKHTRQQLQAEGQRARALRGTGNATGLTAGASFTVQENGDRAVAGAFLVTRVVHTAHCPEVLYVGGEPALGLDRYANTYECSPLDEPFVWRPQVPRRPRVEGPQTAIVTAPEGAAEEIVTDHHGRIRVRFPWDAQRTSPQLSRQSSCWVRVAQSWAGDNWGFLFVPRVGMEVIVHFLDGDPDRPIVTGCVYNGANSTPVKLPAKKTQSGIRTQSSPGGGGYNELRFEDASGDEHVWFRAQKNHTEHVLNDHKVDVDHDDTETIKHDSSIEVGNNRAITVKANERHTVQKNRALTVKGNQQREVSGNESVVVHKTRTTHVDQEWNLTADEAANVEVGGSAKVNIKPDEISMEAPSGITFKCGDNKIEMTPMGISMSTSAGAKVSLEGPNITVDGGAMVTVKSGAVLTIQGTLVKIN